MLPDASSSRLLVDNWGGRQVFSAHKPLNNAPNGRLWMDKTNLILAMKGDFEARAQIINPNVKARTYDYEGRLLPFSDELRLYEKKQRKRR